MALSRSATAGSLLPLAISIRLRKLSPKERLEILERVIAATSDPGVRELFGTDVAAALLPRLFGR